MYYRTSFNRPTCTTMIRLVALAGVLAFTTGCNLVYKLPVNQGNVIEQEQVDQVEVGMTPEQVEFLMGSALVKSELRETVRWDYVSYYLSPRDKELRRNITIVFENGVVSEIIGASNETDREQSQPVDPPPTR
ncbi:MAG: cell envelope protein SmpA [Nevskiales bacterium]|uniref:Outer membrane protein assembly factor BamE n=2 Tax=Abyssibacter profundi TaxID=2182787 RepID=A0A383XQU2_9GAMM|nr:cell envelope protein SmpA [Nevskiales bacterium]PWN54996.1 outer membrane protein assembly factor BamE [Abyssibacter profundi]